MLNWFKKSVLAVDAKVESIAEKNRGNEYFQSGNLEQAVLCYKKAIRLNPQHAEACNNLGHVYELCGNLDEAIAHYRKAVEFKPELLPAQINLGFVLLRLGQVEAAEEELNKVIELDHDHAEALHSLGAIAAQRGDTVRAETMMRRVIELRPENTEAHYILALIFHRSGRLQEAELAYRFVLGQRPNYAGAQYAFGLVLLALGKYCEAWPHYEDRYNPAFDEAVCKMPELPYPQWRGEPLAGKSLLIFNEQGLGDWIQFVRYVPLLKRLGVAHLALLCTSAIEGLLGTVEGVDEVITELKVNEQSYDYWVFPLSLPLHFGTVLETIPSTFPYVHALPELRKRWRDRLPGTGFKVGLVWKGNPEHKNDANRSLPGMSMLAPLWSIPGVSFVSLQKGQGEIEAKHPPPEQPIVHLGFDIKDFSDTAAIVEQLDLVICVDTSIAHLAGALNKPCWVLLSAIRTDWRWLRDREDSPWYESIRLFRQKQSGDWEEVVERVRFALMSHVAGSIDVQLV